MIPFEGKVSDAIPCGYIAYMTIDCGHASQGSAKYTLILVCNDLLVAGTGKKIITVNQVFLTIILCF